MSLCLQQNLGHNTALVRHFQTFFLAQGFKVKGRNGHEMKSWTQARFCLSTPKKQKTQDGAKGRRQGFFFQSHENQGSGRKIFFYDGHNGRDLGDSRKKSFFHGIFRVPIPESPLVFKMS
jgi:hypothetical protein